MRRGLLVAIVVAGVVLIPLQRARSDGNDIDADQVRQSIERGVGYLRRMQHLDGTWPDYGGQVGGVTALSTLALINCGVPIDDEAIQRSLGYLRTLPPKTTYVTSLQTMVFCLAEPQKDLLLIQRNAKRLEETQIKEGPWRGSWAYPGPLSGGDNSNSQFALLGLYEAERAGAKVQERTWQLTLEYWTSAQNANDGSFGYVKRQNGMEDAGTGSMTCAGISSLVVAAGRLATEDAEDDSRRTQCCGNHLADDSAERIERAFRWLGNAFTVQQNPHDEGLLGGAAANNFTITFSTASNGSGGSRPGGSSVTTIGIAKGRRTFVVRLFSSLTGRGKAPTALKTIQTSRPASRLCSSAKDGGRFWSRSYSMARATIGTIIATTSPI